MGVNWVADNVTELALEGQWTNGRSIINVLLVEREEDDPAASAARVGAAWQSNIVAGIVANNYEFLGTHYRDRNEAHGVVGFVARDDDLPTVGGATGASASPNVSFLVHKNIEGRAGFRRGRLYLVGVPESQVDEDGKLPTGDLPDYNTTLESFRDDAVEHAITGDGRLVVAHRPLNPLDDSPVVSTITSMTMDPEVATQRRRLRG